MKTNKKHLLIMFGLCLLPIVGLTLVYLFNIPINALVWGALLLLCPISHLLMMKSMQHEQNDSSYSSHLMYHEEK